MLWIALLAACSRAPDVRTPPDIHASELAASPTQEPACTAAYTANTAISLARAEVVIDRYYPDGEKQHLTLPLDEIRRVELEHVDGAHGSCNAIYLRTEDGRRVVFHDDPKADLHARAWRVAQVMGKPLEVVGRDGTAMSD